MRKGQKSNNVESQLFLCSFLRIMITLPR